MSFVAMASWRTALFPLLAAAGLGVAVSAHAAREITSSDSGGGGGAVATSVQPRLFNCSRDNLGGLDGQFACSGAQHQAFSPTTPADFGVIDSLVNHERSGAWSASNESYRIRVFTQEKVFFGDATTGDFVLAFSGTWLSDPSALTNNQRSGWSSFYYLEDVSLRAGALEAIRYSMVGTDLSSPYSTRGLVVDGVSFYRINRVPEPSGLALVAIALAGMTLVGRRVRKTAQPTI